MYSFDRYAGKYDSWFMENKNVLYSEASLVAYFLGKGERILSVGCGSGLFEMILRENYGIDIVDGVEPSADMASVAMQRGMKVAVTAAEDYAGEPEAYDTILYNGCPGYMTDLVKALKISYSSLKKGGKAILIDIPKESSYGMLYNLAKSLGTWDHPLLHGVCPRNPYSIELVAQAEWRTTAEKVECMKEAGFSGFEFAQTLTRHPLYSDGSVEQPREGYDCGDYVAICAYKR